MLNIQGNSIIDAKPGQVWAHLFEVDALICLIPGCEHLTKVNEHEYQGQIQVGLAAVQGTYETHIYVNQLDEEFVCDLEGDVIGPTGAIQGTGSFHTRLSGTMLC